MSQHHPRVPEVSPVPREDSTGPIEISESTIALNIADRRDDLQATCPKAITLAATCLHAFRASIHGDLTPAMPARSDGYARKESTGAKGFPFEDICALMAIEGPYKAKARAAVLALLTPIMDMFEEPDAFSELGEAGADFIRESSDVAQFLARGATPEKLLKELNEADEKSRRMRRILQGIRSREAENVQ